MITTSIRTSVTPRFVEIISTLEYSCEWEIITMWIILLVVFLLALHEHLLELKQTNNIEHILTYMYMEIIKVNAQNQYGQVLSLDFEEHFSSWLLWKACRATSIELLRSKNGINSTRPFTNWFSLSPYLWHMYVLYDWSLDLSNNSLDGPIPWDALNMLSNLTQM